MTDEAVVGAEVERQKQQPPAPDVPYAYLRVIEEPEPGLVVTALDLVDVDIVRGAVDRDIVF